MNNKVIRKNVVVLGGGYVGLELAQRELDYRRDIYAYDLLAWNLYKNGRLDEARAAIEEALKLGTKDAKLFFHAGMIYSSLDAKAKATEFLSLALSTNRNFHPVFSATAAEILERLEHSTDRAGVERQGQGG